MDFHSSSAGISLRKNSVYCRSRAGVRGVVGVRGRYALCSKRGEEESISVFSFFFSLYGGFD